MAGEEEKLAKPKAPRKRTPKLNPIVKWLRTASATSEAFGWGGLLLGDWFLPAAFFIYAGFVLLAVDVWYEPDLRSYRKRRLIAIFIVIALAGLFTWKYVLVEAPLPVAAIMTDGEYPEGTVVAGMRWNPKFTELTIDITNPTDNIYQDADIVLRPSFPVAAIGWKAGVCSDVSLEDSNHFSDRVIDIDLGTGARSAIPVALLATDAGYRMRCKEIPRRSSITIVMGLADIKWGYCANIVGQPEQQIRDKNCSIRVKFSDFSSYWIGWKDGDVYTNRPKSSS